jgi:hypothetical protein
MAVNQRGINDLRVLMIDFNPVSGRSAGHNGQRRAY